MKDTGNKYRAPKLEEAQKLRILIGAARARLKAAYEEKYDGRIHFDPIVQAQLHCRRIAGIEPRFAVIIDKLEALESQLEEVTGKVMMPLWRARRMFMNDLIETGEIKGDRNIKRSAEFIKIIEKKLANDMEPQLPTPKENKYLLTLLHPIIIESSWAQFRTGYLRDSVLNALIAIGDLLRSRTGLTEDGVSLVEKALSEKKPLLLFNTLETESGRNDQLGFMKILSGAFLGIRNPKAHSLQHDLDPLKAAQYLVFASLLARRIAESKRTDLK